METFLIYIVAQLYSTAPIPFVFHLCLFVFPFFCNIIFRFILTILYRIVILVTRSKWLPSKPVRWPRWMVKWNSMTSKSNKYQAQPPPTHYFLYSKKNYHGMTITEKTPHGWTFSTLTDTSMERRSLLGWLLVRTLRYTSESVLQSIDVFCFEYVGVD